MATRCITRINRALAKAGVEERLHRNLLGGSYYYLSGGSVYYSIYAYALAPEEFDDIARDINRAFTQAGQPAPIKLDA